MLKRKTISTISLVLIMVMFTLICGGCGNSTANNDSSSTSGATTTANTTSTTKKAEPENATEFVQKMNFDTGALTQMAAEMAGGISGVSFKVGEDKYEIYQFSDSAKIQEAKTGNFTINIDGFGKITSKCRVNGNFVMLYSADNQKVFDAFDNVK